MDADAMRFVQTSKLWPSKLMPCAQTSSCTEEEKLKISRIKKIHMYHPIQANSCRKKANKTHILVIGLPANGS